ncbi:MAG: superfamily II DNA/RNA helicase [Alphaproteobacteria bacterium]|jgi:superfamily II DNA/RNA helicase
MDNLMTLFKDLNLHEDLLKSLDKMGFEKATEIQAQFIPMALEGGDVMASAQTGSGKTAAFLLPAFQRFLVNPDASKAQRKKRGPRILVLTPTRELADQVMKVANELRSFTDMTCRCVVGGVPIMKHKRMLRETVDVLVATPGRLIDLMKQGDVHLRDVETFILDEADRMLDMGFSEDVLKISKATPTHRQAMLLSATLEGKTGGIVNKIMNRPKSIELTQATQKHENITQVLYRANDAAGKQALMDSLVEDNNIWQAVIFAGTKAMTEKLCKRIQAQGEKADFLNGDMRQSARTASIRRMQAGQIRFLVATDVAARGLDIKSLTHVINFDLPRNSEDYIHRIGRVGRAGKTGDAISLVSNEQWGLMRGIERMLGEELEQKTIEGLEYVPSKSKPRSNGKHAGGRDSNRPRKPYSKSNSSRDAGAPSDKPKRSFKPRDSEGGSSEGYKGKRSFGDKPSGSSEGYKGKRSFGDKPTGSSEGYKGKRSFGDKPTGSSEGYKGKRSFGDKPTGSSEGYKGKRSFDDKPKGASEGGQKRSFGKPAASADGAKKRSFGNKSNDGFKGKANARVKDMSSERSAERPSKVKQATSAGRKVKSLAGRIAH